MRNMLQTAPEKRLTLKEIYYYAVQRYVPFEVEKELPSSDEEVFQWIRKCIPEMDLMSEDTRFEKPPLLEQCVRKANSSAGKRLLVSVVDLAPEIIPEKLYGQIFGKGDLNKAKMEIQAFALAQEDEHHNLSIHPKIQEAIRKCYPDETDSLFSTKVQILFHLFDCKSVSEDSLNLYKSVNCVVDQIRVKSSPDSMEISLCIRFLFFCKQLSENLQAHSDLLEKCCVCSKGKEIENTRDCSDIEYLGLCLLQLRRFDEAKEYLLRVITYCKVNAMFETMSTSYHNLGKICETQGYFQQAEEFFLMAHKTNEVILPANSLSLALSYSSIATFYQNQGRFVQAEQYNLKALSIEEEIMPNSSDLATSYTILSDNYKAQGRLDEAEKFTFKAVTIEEQVVPNSRNLAMSYYSLASIFKDQQRFDNAEQFGLKALRIQKEVMPNSPSIALTYAIMACIYCATGKLNDAEQFGLKALRIQQQVAPNSRAIAISYAIMANIYRAIGKLRDAEQFCLKALRIQEEFGASSRELAECYYALAMIYKDQRRLDQAEEMCFKTLDIQRDVLKDLTSIVNTYVTLEKIHSAQGRLAKAQQMTFQARSTKDVALLNLSKSPQAKLIPDQSVSLSFESINIECASSDKFKRFAASYTVEAMVAEAEGRHDEAEKLRMKAIRYRQSC